MSTSNTFANLITTKRKQQNLTVKEFAEQAGLSQQSIHAWENSDRIPRPKVLKPLVASAKITKEEFLQVFTPEKTLTLLWSKEAGKAVLLAMQEQQYNTATLAEEMNVDASTIRRWMNGVVRPQKKRQIKKLVSILNTNMDELVSLAGWPPAGGYALGENRTEFSKFLENTMKEKNIVHGNYEDSLGIPDSTLIGWMRGGVTPKTTSLAKLSAKLKTIGVTAPVSKLQSMLSSKDNNVASWKEAEKISGTEANQILGENLKCGSAFAELVNKERLKLGLSLEDLTALCQGSGSSLNYTELRASLTGGNFRKSRIPYLVEALTLDKTTVVGTLIKDKLDAGEPLSRSMGYSALAAVHGLALYKLALTVGSRNYLLHKAKISKNGISDENIEKLADILDLPVEVIVKCNSFPQG